MAARTMGWQLVLSTPLPLAGQLSYTLENLSFAILGAMFGSLIALAIEFPATFAKTARNFLMFRQVDWK